MRRRKRSAIRATSASCRRHGIFIEKLRPKNEMSAGLASSGLPGKTN